MQCGSSPPLSPDVSRRLSIVFFHHAQGLKLPSESPTLGFFLLFSTSFFCPSVIHFNLIHFYFSPPSLFHFSPCATFPHHLQESVLFISSEYRGSSVHASHSNQFQLRQHNQTKRRAHFNMGIVASHLPHFPPAPSSGDILFSLRCHYVNHRRHVVMCECSC